MLNYQSLLCLLCIALANSVYAQEILIGDFAQRSLIGWEKQEFKGTTQYDFIQQEKKTVLRAISNGTASGIIYKTKIDLNKTPYLNWSWKIDNSYENYNETKKAGDDYPARISIIASTGIFFWQTLAINYIWASQQKIHKVWDNPYTSNVKMMALQSGKKYQGIWRVEKRNVKKDFKTLFGIDIISIDAVAIMTDSDNTQSNATAYYGQISFSSQ